MLALWRESVAFGGLARADAISLCVYLCVCLCVPDSHAYRHGDSHRYRHGDRHYDAYHLTTAAQVTAQCQDMQPPRGTAAVSRAFGLAVAITAPIVGAYQQQRVAFRETGRGRDVRPPGGAASCRACWLWQHSPPPP